MPTRATNPSFYVSYAKIGAYIYTALKSVSGKKQKKNVYRCETNTFFAALRTGKTFQVRSVLLALGNYISRIELRLHCLYVRRSRFDDRVTRIILLTRVRVIFFPLECTPLQPSFTFSYGLRYAQTHGRLNFRLKAVRETQKKKKIEKSAG